MKFHHFDPAILREYDVRGEVGRQLGPADAYALGRGFATVLREAGGQRVVVGRDGRISSPELEAALVTGLAAGGVDVIRIGLGPTPMLYFAEASMKEVQGGIQVTGSHNPANHNGFKMVLGGRPFCGEELRELGRRAALGDWSEGSGVGESREILGAYVDRLLAALDGLDRAALARLRIGWDAGNGAAGPALERLIEKLPGEHHALFTQVDGTFPHHHPDPTVEANLADLKALVAAKSLHFGVAFDGDGDRIVVVDAKGRVLWGDQLLMILAEDLLARAPGATIIADVKASQVLFDRIAALGGRPVMGKTGHSLIKSEMKRIGAPLGGEMTGHLMFADQWYGFDDALYASLRLIAATLRMDKSVTAMRDAMPEPVNTPELRITVDDARKFAVVDEVAARLSAAGAQMATIDGVRVTTPDGWWLLRASNTQDALTLRAESASAEGLAHLLAAADAQLALSGVSR
ncbi:MAG: phosphomannomutase/phosphoglucomutase, partial [Proteobacteria bacterium]|nr:phosphomannomutase/phosphoglucomutase [Pseudomonadota bacterium]